LLWNVGPDEHRILSGEVPAGACQGRNDFGNIGYDGPCPPHGHGTHHYHFTLYAVADSIALPDGADIARLQAALSDTTISTTDLVGTYAR